MVLSAETLSIAMLATLVFAPLVDISVCHSPWPPSARHSACSVVPEFTKFGEGGFDLSSLGGLTKRRVAPWPWRLE